MQGLLSNCNICPRLCGADRAAGQAGYCGATGLSVRVARAAPHMWEEPCISGKNGSGTVFFGGCNMKCTYCQNGAISRAAVGRELSVRQLADEFERLQREGVHNINLVTPTHYMPQILVAIDLSGVTIPFVYNTSGYELPQSLELLKGRVSVFLTDFKYADNRLAGRYSAAPDYFERATAALDKMVELAGEARFDSDGMMTAGVIVRHLVLPGHTDDSLRVMEHLHRRYGDKIYVSIMNQYTPPKGAAGPLGRKLTAREYDRVVDYAVSLGIERGFIQEGDTAKDSFIPEFDL